VRQLLHFILTARWGEYLSDEGMESIVARIDERTKYTKDKLSEYCEQNLNAHTGMLQRLEDNQNNILVLSTNFGNHIDTHKDKVNEDFDGVQISRGTFFGLLAGIPTAIGGFIGVIFKFFI